MTMYTKNRQGVQLYFLETMQNAATELSHRPLFITIVIELQCKELTDFFFNKSQYINIS